MDLICGDYRNHMTTEHEPIVSAVRQGLLPEAVIDRALRRLFAARIRLGLFDPPATVPSPRITRGRQRHAGAPRAGAADGARHRWCC